MTNTAEIDEVVLSAEAWNLYADYLSAVDKLQGEHCFATPGFVEFVETVSQGNLGGMTLCEACCSVLRAWIYTVKNPIDINSQQEMLSPSELKQLVAEKKSNSTMFSDSDDRYNSKDVDLTMFPLKGDEYQLPSSNYQEYHYPWQGDLWYNNL